MTLKLHHLNASRSQRIVWLLLELGIEHEIIHHDRHSETRLAPPELLNIHPMGKSPLLDHDGLIIAETGAIAEYLLAKFDPDHTLHPHTDSEDFPRYLEWVHSAEGAVFLPGLFSFYLMNADLLEHPLAAVMAAEAAKAANHIEAHLSQYSYFAGETFTAADCLTAFQVMSAEARDSLSDKPATKAWLSRVQARPAFKAMLEVGI
ncbi:MAG: glutathione S-transferase [Pseudomonadota bacterium]